MVKISLGDKQVASEKGVGLECEQAGPDSTSYCLGLGVIIFPLFTTIKPIWLKSFVSGHMLSVSPPPQVSHRPSKQFQGGHVQEKPVFSLLTFLKSHGRFFSSHRSKSSSNTDF